METSLADLVTMCSTGQRCEEDCSRRAYRFIEDAGIKPAGGKAAVERVAQERRDLAYGKCIEACTSVRNQCPEPSTVRAWTASVAANSPSSPAASSSASASSKTASASSSGSSNGGGWFSNLFGGSSSDKKKEQATTSVAPFGGENGAFPQEAAHLRVCENAAAHYVSVLFWIANAPSKIEFESEGPKPSDRYKSGGAGGSIGKSGGSNPLAAMGGGAGGGFGNDMAMGGGQGDGPRLPRPGLGNLPQEVQDRLEAMAARSEASALANPGNTKTWKG
jgi:hypothetical protein